MMTLNRVIDQAIFGVSFAAGTRATISDIVSSKLHQNSNLKLLIQRISRESRTTDKTDPSTKLLGLNSQFYLYSTVVQGFSGVLGGFPFDPYQE